MTVSPLVTLGVTTPVFSSGDDEAVEHDLRGRALPRRRRRVLLQRPLMSQRRQLTRGAPPGDGPSGIDVAEPLILVLQNAVQISDEREASFVNLTCPVLFIGRVSSTCPNSNASVSVNCLGVSLDDEVFRLECAVTTAPSCLVWDGSTQTYNVGAAAGGTPNGGGGAATCRPISWTLTNTTCACDAAELLGTAAAHNHGPVTLLTRRASVSSGSLLVLDYFVSVFSVPVGPVLFAKVRCHQKTSLL